MNDEKIIHPSSFRDPSGFLFFRDRELFRQINISYKTHYDLLNRSGLYTALTSKKLLLTHEEKVIRAENPEISYKIIKPFAIPFISYPYEWCFSQLQHAALLTLEIQKISLEYGMTLKDASAYNVQFFKGKPIFIDTLSFERYEPGSPWVAYRQFCRHFLAPLALMHHTDIRLSQLFLTSIDGIPLDVASTLLPKRTWLNAGILLHIHLHAKSEKKYADVHMPIKQRKISKNEFFGLLDSLTGTIKKMNWHPGGTEWAGYYEDTNYSRKAFEHKKAIVTQYLNILAPETVWDLGANNGLFSRIASEKGIFTLAFDIDPACVELNYREIVRRNEQNILPLLLDLTNPSPGIGWQNEERDSMIKRGPADTVLALALVHHIAISNNVPLERIAEFFSGICNSLIIEFVPKEDSQVKKLLLNRRDIFSDYDEGHFEKAFINHFKMEQKIPVMNTNRVIYLYRKRKN